MNARAILIAGSVMMTGACASAPAPDIATPVPVLPASYVFAPEADTNAALVSLLPFEDAAFDRLAAQALASSPSLAEAAARVEQARAGAARAGAERLPTIGADGSVTGTRTNPGAFGANLPPGVAFDSERVAYAANVTARWDLDLFGRLKAQERAAIARIDAADASARAVKIALLAEIAASVIDWRTLQAREAALRDDLASAEALARLAGVRERAGIAPGFDRVRAEGSASSSLSRLAALESERARIIGRLVTLAAQGGASVRSALAQGQAGQELPVAPRTLPSALLLNRPDVLAAAATLAAEDAELAATARKRFPVISLSGAIGLLAFGIGDLFNDESLVGSLAAGIAGPLLDFGRIQAEIDGVAAEKKAAFEAYRGTAYTALGEAETAYGLVASADNEAQTAFAEAESLRRAARLANTRYKSGLADFLTVLEARRAADSSGERAALALGRAKRARVLLWQALGGSGIS